MRRDQRDRDQHAGLLGGRGGRAAERAAERARLNALGPILEAQHAATLAKHKHAAKQATNAASHLVQRAATPPPPPPQRERLSEFCDNLFIDVGANIVKTRANLAGIASFHAFLASAEENLVRCFFYVQGDSLAKFYRQPNCFETCFVYPVGAEPARDGTRRCRLANETCAATGTCADASETCFCHRLARWGRCGCEYFGSEPALLAVAC